MSLLTRDLLAERVARDIPPGAVVNLGIGIPTAISNYLAEDRHVVLHTENGMLGMGPEAQGDLIDTDLINAGKIPVTEMAGASYFHHAESFAMMRGGHLDVCVLGAYQVASNGDLANWLTTSAEAIPAVGGAMDLAIGAKSLWVMMDLLTKEGQSKVVSECTYPLTGLGCVSRIYTDHAVFDLNAGQLDLVEAFDGHNSTTLSAIIGLPVYD